MLEASCFACHSATAAKVKGGLRLDSREGLLAGGDTGPSVVPGKPGESPLIRAIRHEEGLEMPPGKPKLADPVLADFARWVDLGAPFPGPGADAAGPRLDDARRHWAFRPVTKGTPPEVEDRAWVRTPVDAFVLARLESKGWAPSPEAEGYEYDRAIPDAWRFRDDVIKSLNADKPFDRFLVEQVAGDEVAPDSSPSSSARGRYRSTASGE